MEPLGGELGHEGGAPMTGIAPMLSLEPGSLQMKSS